MPASRENAVQVPALRAVVLAKDPEAFAARIRRDVVVAPHFGAVPPAGFDALGACDEVERSDEALRMVQQPRRPRARRMLLIGCAPLHARACRTPVALGPVIVLQRDAEHAIAAEPRA